MIDLSPLLEPVIQLLAAGLMALGSWAVARLIRRLGLQADSEVRTYLDQALRAGVEWAAEKARRVGLDQARIEVRNAMVADAVNYAVAKVPDALALEEGPHTLTARVRDHAGNEAQQAAEFRVDLQPPGISVVAPPPGTYLRPPVEIRVQYQDESALDAGTLQILVNGIDQTLAFVAGPDEAAAPPGLAARLVAQHRRRPVEIAQAAVVLNGPVGELGVGAEARAHRLANVGNDLLEHALSVAIEFCFGKPEFVFAGADRFDQSFGQARTDIFHKSSGHNRTP